MWIPGAGGERERGRTANRRICGTEESHGGESRGQFLRAPPLPAQPQSNHARRRTIDGRRGADVRPGRCAAGAVYRATLAAAAAPSAWSWRQSSQAQVATTVNVSVRGGSAAAAGGHSRRSRASTRTGEAQTTGPVGADHGAAAAHTHSGHARATKRGVPNTHLLLPYPPAVRTQRCPTCR